MKIVGIDLGTTNSLIGVIDRGRPRLFQDEGSSLIPSIVHYGKSGEVEVGTLARKKRITDPVNTLFSTKRFLGRGILDVKEAIQSLPFDFSPSTEQMVRFRAGGKDLNPIEVGAQVLRHLKSIAEKELSEPVKKAVVTVPAYFNDSQRQATKLAGELAGLEVVRILNEPTAACLAYGLDKKARGTMAIFDLGGGTFDISVLRVTDGVFEVLATNGDTALGGDDFDHEIASRLGQEMEKAVGVNPQATAEGKSRLLLQSQAIKHSLSENTESTFTLEAQGKKYERTLSRVELETWLAPILERAKEPCLNCLQDAGVEYLSDVVLVGGSTRVPLVREFVRTLFKREPICSLNPDEVVAIGAAVQANILAGQSGEMLLLDVIPLSLGLETVGGVVSKLIHRNSTIPVSASETYSTSVDGQSKVLVHVLQGERELATDNRSLARFELHIPPLPAGIPKIEVEFTVDANGILSVRANELRTGEAASITVNPTYGLNDTEVEKMLMESFDHAESDFEKRFLVEAKVEAEALIRATRKSLQKGQGILSEKEKVVIESTANDLEKLLASTTLEPIKIGIETLNEVTRPFAEKLMDHAVREALTNKEIPT